MRQLWFGPRGHMKWIKMPMAGGTHSPVGYTEQAQYLSGRAAVRTSFGSHQEYEFSWRGARSELRHITDCASGILGDGPVYFLDPMTMDQNVLPAHWATPLLGTLDAPQLYGTRRPKSAPIGVTDGSWPAAGALFRRDTTAPKEQLYIPIPPGHSFWLGFAGTPSSVRLSFMLGDTFVSSYYPPATDPSLPLLDNSMTPRQNSRYDGVMIELALPSNAPHFIIYGMRALVLGPGQSFRSVKERGFVSGQGHTGVRFAGKPQVTPYSLPYDSVGMTARLVEVDE